MNRREFEHGLRAAGAISKSNVLVVIGSQAVHGWGLPEVQEFLQSQEIDVYAPGVGEREDEISDMIQGALGPGSLFERTHGFWVDGVSSKTAKLPYGWAGRTWNVKNANTDYVEGRCLEPHDLAVAKYYAGREKDLEYNQWLVRYGLIQAETMDRRLAATELDPEKRERMALVIRRHFELREQDIRIGRGLQQATEEGGKNLEVRRNEGGKIELKMKGKDGTVRVIERVPSCEDAAMAMLRAGLKEPQEVYAYKRELEQITIKQGTEHKEARAARSTQGF